MQEVSKPKCGPPLECVMCLKTLWYELEIATSQDNLRQKAAPSYRCREVTDA